MYSTAPKKYHRISPPRLAGWMVTTIARYDDRFGLIGDFDEEFSEKATDRGSFRARLWYWHHAIVSLPIFVKDWLTWRIRMLKNYIKTAFRNMRRYKGHAFINILGLALGMTVCFLILLWILDETSYDRYHKNGDSIYRLGLDISGSMNFSTSATMAPAAPALIKDYPEVIDAARILNRGRTTISYGDKLFQETLVQYADPSFLRMFTVPVLQGDAENALTIPYSAVLTEDVALKIFGSEDPIGKILRFDNEKDHHVTAVIKNVPRNTHMPFVMLVSMSTLEAEQVPSMQNWMDIQYRTYLLLAPGTSRHSLESKFPEFADRYLMRPEEDQNTRIRMFLEPLQRIHLYSTLQQSTPAIFYVTLFAGIAAFVLLIACFNFINLTTARAATRLQEVGMRRTLGAYKKSLIGQFLGESILYSLLAWILSCALLAAALPLFNNLVGRDLWETWKLHPEFTAIQFLIGLFAGLAAGAYPAFYLSSLEPAIVLKKGTSRGKGNALFRKVLVVIQFTISITLIIGTLTIHSQMRFIQNRDLGFDEDHVLVISGLTPDVRRNYPSIRHELASIPGVLDAGGSVLVPGLGNLITMTLPEGFPEDEPMTVDYIEIDAHYLPVMKMQILQGRNFSEEMKTDRQNSVIINETAARRFQWDDPVGKKLFLPEGGRTNVTVIGVVKDFHRESLRDAINPLILLYDTEAVRRISLRLAPGPMLETVNRIREKWHILAPNTPLTTDFQEDILGNQYSSERRLETIAFVFGLLAVFIGCLGLFGLAAFTAEKRTKEIGIRKVMGASSATIISMLSREFLMLVAISNLLAWPLAFYLMNRWMQGFAYRAGNGFILYILSGALALAIALITVGYQALKAASMNPANALRYE